MSGATLDVFVPGTPAPKGSTKAFVVKSKRTGRHVAVTKADNSDAQDAWAPWVRLAMTGACGDSLKTWPVLGPVTVSIRFVMPRRLVRASKTITMPHTRKPDIDKLLRCVLDAMTGVVWIDDAQVTALHGTKREAEPDEPGGAQITVAVLDPDASEFVCPRCARLRPPTSACVCGALAAVRAS